MSDFPLAWLRLRESADLAGRDPKLARTFAAALTSNRPVRLIDLASGGGANARALLPRVAGDQEWRLIDRDRGLLSAQGEEFTLWARRQGYPITAGGGRIAIAARQAQWRLQALPLDLARDLESLDEIAADGIAAAAFFDLVSADWLARFVAMTARRRLPLLAALTVDGRRDWQPALAEDAIVGAAFTRHQVRDKGFGPALGGAAPTRLEELMRGAGYTVERAVSDWRLGPRDGTLLDALLAGEAAAAAASAPDQQKVIAAWTGRRREQLALGQLRATVGHCDVLALPA